MNRILTFFQSGSVPELDMHESKNFLPAQFVHSDIARRVFGNSMQASYFERFHWSILNFWTLPSLMHDGNGTRNSKLQGLESPKIPDVPI